MTLRTNAFPAGIIGGRPRFEAAGKNTSSYPSERGVTSRFDVGCPRPRYEALFG
jgi:hypothetical protein